MLLLKGGQATFGLRFDFALNIFMIDLVLCSHMYLTRNLNETLPKALTRKNIFHPQIIPS